MSTKSKMGRPKVDSELVRSRIERPELDGIDAFAADIAVNADAPIGRPEAIRRIVRDWLIGHGYLQPGADAQA